ncbi:MAG TPA: hypothetical protein VG206_28010 [Terriglobia bacterium]|nr:hypothetical protein [Terriglobia bacterium]
MAGQNGGLERKIEFLVEAQARASAQIEKLAEGHAILTRVMARLSERTKVNEDHLEATMTVVEHLAEKVDHLGGRVEQIGQKLDELGEMQRRNEEASEKRFKAFDQRLNILMNVVERHIAGPGHQHQA